ncbi:MAG: DUF4760 domain-containing protein [Pseudomonadota bacterium]
MKLKWTLLAAFVCLYLIGVVGVGWHTFGATDPTKAVPSVETIKVVFIMLGGLGIIFPTYLNIWQSLETARLLEDNARRNKIENTFNLLEKWDDKSLFDARKFTRELKDQKNQLSPDQIRDRIAASPDLRQSVILLFNYFELVRISLDHDRIDPGVVRQSLGPTALDICKRFEPWLDTQPDKADVDKFVKLLSQ